MTARSPLLATSGRHVYDRENEDDAPWGPTGVRLSTFLVYVAAFEAVWGASDAVASAAWVSRDRFDEVVGPLIRVPGPGWRWPGPGHHLYVSDDIVAFAGPNVSRDEDPASAEFFEIFAAGKDQRALDYLAGIDGVEWDVAAWDDGRSRGT